MDLIKQKWKKTLISSTWERCKSLGSSSKKKYSAGNSLTRSKTWHCTTKSPSPEKERPKKKCQVAPEGCFTVYVGPERQRFVVKTRLANHPLFKTLLEDAESEYGYDTQGPILLPCDVDLFYKVLAQMERGDDEDDDEIDHHPKGYSPLILCSPTRRTVKDGYGGAYRLFTPSRLLRLNGF